MIIIFLSTLNENYKTNRFGSQFLERELNQCSNNKILELLLLLLIIPHLQDIQSPARQLFSHQCHAAKIFTPT